MRSSTFQQGLILVEGWQHAHWRVSTAWNQAADVLANGDEFDPDEIDILARSIRKQH
jgi:hypothetical protein